MPRSTPWVPYADDGKITPFHVSLHATRSLCWTMVSSFYSMPRCTRAGPSVARRDHYQISILAARLKCHWLLGSIIVPLQDSARPQCSLLCDGIIITFNVSQHASNYLSCAMIWSLHSITATAKRLKMSSIILNGEDQGHSSALRTLIMPLFKHELRTFTLILVTSGFYSTNSSLGGK